MREGDSPCWVFKGRDYMEEITSRWNLFKKGEFIPIIQLTLEVKALSKLGASCCALELPLKKALELLIYNQLKLVSILYDD